MKIGFAGNTNNYPFMLALALSRLGHQIIFVVDSTSRLHRPEFYNDDNNYPNIQFVECNHVIKKFYNYLFWPSDLKKLITHFSSCDVIFTNDLWPIIVKKLSKPYIVLLTGTDLEYFADPALVMKDYWYQSKKMPLFFRVFRVAIATIISMKQRSAIRNAKVVNYFPKGIVLRGDKLLESIGINASQRLNFMMTDIHKNKFVALPGQIIPRILVAARHSFKNPDPCSSVLDYKGTDIFLMGVSVFLKKTSLKVDIILVRKGPAVAEIGRLIDELNLQDCVTWLDEMSQKELKIEYLKSDIVVDQLSNGMVGMVGFDAMAMGRPLIANGRPEIWEPIFGESSPICQAKTPEDVATQIEFLYPVENRINIGLKSRAYVEKFFSSESAAKQCLKVILNA